MPNEYESGLEGYGIGGGEGEAAAPPEPGMFAGMGHFGRNAAGTGYDMGPFTPLASGIDTGLLHAGALLTGVPAEDHRDEAGGIGTLYAFTQQQPDDEATSNAKRQEYSRYLLDVARRIQPDARTTGSAYRLIHSVADFGTKLALGSAGGPAGMVASAGGISAFEAYHAAKDEGLDDATAQRMAGAEGFTSGLFGLVPGAGGVLAEGASAGGRALIDAALGVGANVPLGMTNRYLNHKILESAGYPDLAAQYRTLDGSAMFADAAMGLLPLGAHLLTTGTGKALDIAARIGAKDGLVKDAADVVNLQRTDLNLAPGIPADASAAAAHEEAMRVGMEQVLKDQPVDLEGTRIAKEGANFVGRPAEPESMDLAMTVFAEHLRESGIADQLAELDGRDRQDLERAGVPIPEKAIATESAKAEETGTSQPLRSSVSSQVEPSAAARTVFRGHGRAEHGSVYNGTESPILGQGTYYAFDREHAAQFGPNVEETTLDLKNPLRITSDEQWRAITKQAGWEYPNPHGLSAAKVDKMTARLQGLAKAAGHDGIIVEWDNSAPGDMDPRTGAGIKTLRDVFDRPQAIRFQESAPRETPRKAPAALLPDERTDSIVQYLAKHGVGIDRAEAEANGIDRKDMNTVGKFGIRHAFKSKGGMSIDEAQEFLQQRGYLQNSKNSYVHPLLEALDAELHGKPQYSIHKDYEAVATKEQDQAAFDAQQRALDRVRLHEVEPDAKGWTIEEQDLTALLPKIDEDLAERLAIRYENAQTPEAKSAVYKEIEEAARGNGKANAGGGGEAALELKRETPAELAERGRGEQRSAAAEQRAVLSAAERARGDRERDQPFSLTGSDRASDANPDKADAFAAEILKDRPETKIVDADGAVVDADAVAMQAKAMEDQATAEAGKAFDAATNCFNRGGDA